MDSAEYFERVKMKKRDRILNHKSSAINFPNKVSGARMTGGVTWSYVEGGGAEDYSKYVEEFSFDATLLADLQRVNFAPQSIPYETGTEGVFYIIHSPQRPWDVNLGGGNGLSEPYIFVDNPDYFLGSGTIKWYSRAELEDPWTLDSTWPLSFYGYLYLRFRSGGNPISGGRGADSDEKRMTMDIRLEVLGVDSDYPSFVIYDFTFGGEIPTADSPFPWTDPWPGYTDIFTDSYNGYIAGGSGDRTGSSCDLAFEWIYAP